MTWTTHGYHIPDSPFDPEVPEPTENCGGVSVCVQCANEALAWKRADLAAHPIAVEKDLADTGQFQLLARGLVADYFNSVNGTGQHDVVLTVDNVRIVWFAKVLKNWKAVLSTTVDDGRYYEVTCNGDANEVYLDVYQKVENVQIPL